MGGVLIPTGIYVLTRDPCVERSGVTVCPNGADSVSMGGAIILGVGIGSLVGGILNLALTTQPFGRLHENFEERRASRRPPAQVVADTEREWRERAESSRTSRQVFGVIAIGIGGAALAVGTVVAFLNEPLGDLTPNAHYALAAASSGLGALTVLAGFQTYFMAEPVEVGWETYRRTKNGTTATAFRAQLGGAPLPSGGGLVTLGTTF
jgi:hypothetical protein